MLYWYFKYINFEKTITISLYSDQCIIMVKRFKIYIQKFHSHYTTYIFSKLSMTDLIQKLKTYIKKRIPGFLSKFFQIIKNFISCKRKKNYFTIAYWIRLFEFWKFSNSYSSIPKHVSVYIHSTSLYFLSETNIPKQI